MPLLISFLSECSWFYFIHYNLNMNTFGLTHYSSEIAMHWVESVGQDVPGIRKMRRNPNFKS